MRIIRFNKNVLFFLFKRFQFEKLQFKPSACYIKKVFGKRDDI